MRRNAFRTGDIAEFMGITNMGVLYLEKRGLLKADREENGYRSYSTQTLTHLGILKSYERMGFSLNEARRLADSTSTELLEALRKRRAELNSELKRIEHVIAGLEVDDVATDHLDDANSRIAMRPPMLYCPVWEELYDMERLDEATRRKMRDVDVSWLALMPYMKYCARISRGDGAVRLEKGNCLLTEHASGARINEWVTRLPPRPCLTFNFRGMDYGALLQMAEDHLTRMGCRMALPAYAPILFFPPDGVEARALSKMYIPVEKPIDTKPAL